MSDINLLNFAKSCNYYDHCITISTHGTEIVRATSTSSLRLSLRLTGICCKYICENVFV